MDLPNLKSEAEDNFNRFLNLHNRSLMTYTKDPRIQYIGDETAESMHFDAKEKILTIPLDRFVDQGNPYITLWEIYDEMAMYANWLDEPEDYANRINAWSSEIAEITFILERALKGQKGFDHQRIAEYVESEIRDFLYDVDRYQAYLNVQTKEPLYADVMIREEIHQILRNRGYNRKRLEHYPSHQVFVKSFLTRMCQCETEEMEIQPMSQTIDGMTYYQMIEKQCISMIVNHERFSKRESWIKTMIYPYFKSCWLYEIEHMSHTDEADSETSKSYELLEQKDDEQASQSHEEQRLQQEIIDSLLDEHKAELSKHQTIGRAQEEAYATYRYYENLVAPQRAAMREFWNALIGGASQEITVKKFQQSKGSLDVSSLIQRYPDFFEAQQSGNFKQLNIFSRYALEASPKQLPENIDIYFVLDNSGSMDAIK